MSATRRRLRKLANAACSACAAFASLAPAALGQDEVNEPADRSAAPAAVRADERRRIEVFERAARSVVCIYADASKGGGGSGVIIDPRGYGLTNFHVIQECLETRRGVGGLNDGKLYPLHVLGIDPGGDVAMFQLEGRDRFEAAPLGDSSALKVGQWVAALGNPFLLAEDFTPTLTLGVISGLQRYQPGEGNFLEYGDCIQVSTSINPGNSGGPLFDMQGRVIGINGRASFEERGRVNVGLGYAISINQIKRFIPGLRAGRLVEHGSLGATVRAAGDQLIVDAIQDLSPAEQAGLQLGDELLEISGRSLTSANDYNNIMATYPMNWPVSLKYRRFGVTYETTARLERLPLEMKAPYLVDLAHNQREAGLVLEILRERTGGGGLARLAQATLQVADEAPRAVTLRLGTLPGATSAPAMDNSLLRELEQAMSVLTTRIEIDLSWEHVGGDEVDGRICSVIQQKMDDGARWRWKIDESRGELLECALLPADDAMPIRWKPADAKLFGGLRAPTRWTRLEPGAAPVTLRIESVAPLASPESQP